MVAVKRLKQSTLAKKGKEDFASGVEAMAGLRHASLVRLLAYCNQGKERILVYEYVQKKSLRVHIFGTTSTSAPLDWERRLEIIKGIAHGVWCLQRGSDESVIHGDLKPGNILLDDEWNVKIGDFGTAELFAVDQIGSSQTIVISPGYAAPELHRGEMTCACDVYSLGVIILETLSGQTNGVTNSLLAHVVGLYKKNKVMELLDKKMALPNRESELSSKLKQCIEVALHCVQLEPDERPTMSAIIAMLTNTSAPVGPIRHPTLDSMMTAWSQDHEVDPLRLI